MRIVHFSDLHFAAWPDSPRALFDKRALGSFNYLVRRRAFVHEEWIDTAWDRIAALSPDCLVCSGDITCVGSPAEFARAVPRLTALAERVACPLLYVPGNHDAYVKDRRCREALERAFRDVNAGRWDLAQLPVRFRLANVSFLLVNESLPTGPFSSGGRLSPPAADAFERWLSEPRDAGECRVLVGHFPTRGPDGAALSERRRLKGGDAILRALTGGRLDLSLCGHIHTPYCLHEPGPGMEVSAGALTVAGSLDIIDIDSAGHVGQQSVSIR